MTQFPHDEDLGKVLLGQLDLVKFELRGEAMLVGCDMTDPGTMDWDASATISLRLEDEEFSEKWHSAPGVSLSSAGRSEDELVVFEASGLTVDLAHVDDVSAALDERSQGYAEFIPLFGDTRTVGFLDLSDELEEDTESLGKQVVIIDHVRLAPAWRGLGGVGRLLTGRLLRWLAADARLVAVHPFPIDLDRDVCQDPVVFKPAMARIRRVWKSIGFTPFNDKIWTMDPGSLKHTKALTRIERRLKLESRECC